MLLACQTFVEFIKTMRTKKSLITSLLVCQMFVEFVKAIHTK